MSSEFIKKCPVCQSEITGMRASRKRFCSETCKNAHHNKQKDWKSINSERKEYLKAYRQAKKQEATQEDAIPCTNDSCPTGGACGSSECCAKE